MKKLAIVLLAGAVIGLTSCGSNENNASKEQIDSMATVRTDTMQAALKAQNDSLINAMAKMRADSAMNATKAVTTTTTTTTTARPANTKTTHTSSSSKPASVHTNDNTAPATNPTSNKPTITKDQQEQQNNKFNER